MNYWDQWQFWSVSQRATRPFSIPTTLFCILLVKHQVPFLHVITNPGHFLAVIVAVPGGVWVFQRDLICFSLLMGDCLFTCWWLFVKQLLGPLPPSLNWLYFHLLSSMAVPWLYFQSKPRVDGCGDPGHLVTAGMVGMGSSGRQ